MAVRSTTVTTLQLIFGLYIIPYYGDSTRFLPMLVWDHLNPQLWCRCNWPVIPHIDRYDRLEFVCPTLKISMNQLDGYSRPEIEMNENLFRREWHGSQQELLQSIQDNSIQSFCDPNKSTKLHTCRNGEYTSTAVTFKNSRDVTKQYKIGHTYIFYNNADDGHESSLTSRKANCSMFFAVHISDQEKAKYDLTFGKTALLESCMCKEPISTSSDCPPPETPSSTTWPEPTIQVKSPRQLIPALVSDATTEPQSPTLMVDGHETDEPSLQYSTDASEPTTGSTEKKQRLTTDSVVVTSCSCCNYPWLTTWMLIIFICCTVMLPIVLCWCICLLIARRKAHTSAEGFNNNEIYYPRTNPYEGHHFLDKPNSPQHL